MFVGELHAGERWTDILAWWKEGITIGDDGFGEFRCHPTSVSVFVNERAEGRHGLGKYIIETNK